MRVIATMEEDMRAASEAMDFEEAARLRRCRGEPQGDGRGYQ